LQHRKQGLGFKRLLVKKGGQHRLYGTVATVDRQKIDILVRKIPQARLHVPRRLNVTMDDLGMTVDDTPDVTQTVKISAAEWIDDNADARSPAGL
jgi:hypothetical protein